MTDPSPDTSSRRTAAVASPISRRSVLAGSAFAVPAIMMTASTPAFAASGLTLAFDRSSYSGQGCSAISGVTVTASDGGTRKAGVSVTVSLSNGYTFSGGGTSSTGVTGSAGSLTLPDMNVPAAGGSGTATASSAGATSSSASLWGTPATRFTYIDGNGEHVTTGVPSGSTPAFSATFLTSDGRLINGGNGSVQASDVDTFGQIFTSPDGSFWAAPLKKKDGSFTYIDGNGEHATTGIPSGSTPAFSATFLTSDGRLINGTNGSVQASGVDTFGQIFTSPDHGFWSAPLKKRDGTFTFIDANGEHPSVGVPSGSTPAFSATFLASDGRLINGGDGSVQASDVDAFGHIFTAPDGSFWSAPLKERRTSC